MADEIAKNPEDSLTTYEKEELQKWRRHNDFVPLSTVTAVRMYQLFLLGHSCDEIVRANAGMSLGMVLDARIRHEWDRRRDAYVDQLYNEAGAIVKQRQMEGAIFLGDVLAAAHVEHGDKIRKFLQTRDPKDLPDQLRVTSITTYKMVVDALMKITGQDRVKGESGPAVNVIGNNVTLQEAPKQAQTMDGNDAFSVLRGLERLDAEAKKEADAKKKK